jgi:hypothetical protein
LEIVQLAVPESGDEEVESRVKYRIWQYPHLFNFARFVYRLLWRPKLMGYLPDWYCGFPLPRNKAK